MVETKTVEALKAPERISKLEALGFTSAANKVKELQDKSRKMAIAYEHFTFIRPEWIAAFQVKLREQSKNDPEGYKTLRFTPVAEYEKTPPDSVLVSLENAIGKKCFDSFEVAHIERVKDPIIFGRIKGCADAFYIDQWDNDVSIAEILGSNKG